MKIKVSALITGIVFLTLLLPSITSCQTGAEYQITSSSDCLILFPCNLINPKAAPTSRTYSLHLSDGQVKRIGKKKSSYIPIIIKEPGVSVVKVTSKIEADATIGSESEQAVENMVLPYEPGMAIVAEATFVQRIEVIDTYKFMSYSGFIKTTSEQKADIIRQFKKKKYSAGWEI